jgi:hypothetical protein
MCLGGQSTPTSMFINAVFLTSIINVPDVAGAPSVLLSVCAAHAFARRTYIANMPLRVCWSVRL